MPNPIFFRQILLSQAALHVPAPAAGHSYWRMEFTNQVAGGDGGSNIMDFYEAEFLASSVDLATGGTASASDSSGSFPPSQAFDNNGGTRWISTSAASWPKWLQYQFASPITPDQISITPWSAGRTPGQIIVKHSDNGSSFTTYGSSTFNTVLGDWADNTKKTFTLIP